MNDACNEVVNSYVREMDDCSRDSGIFFKGLRRNI